MRFQGKTVLVTGAGGGIGRATALEFAREGATVMAVDIDRASAEATAAAIGETGAAAHFRAVDLTDPAAVSALFADIAETFPTLDVAINGAGVNDRGGPIENVDFAAFRRTMAVNLEAVFLCMQAEIRAMKRQGHGAIVNIASQAAHEGAPYFAAYTASKHAVAGLTKVAALEVARSNIQINAISPGAVNAGLFTQQYGAEPETLRAIIESLPTGRLIEAEEVARSILFLASDDAAAFIGESLRFDGGHADVKASTLWHYPAPAAATA